MATLSPDKLSGSPISIPKEFPQQKMREIILQMLYALDMAPSTEESLVPLLMSQTAVSQKHVLLALNHTKKVLEKSSELDLIIENALNNKPFDSLDLMEKNVLRLTLFEYLYKQPINGGILIAEAIRLVKKFSYSEACPFIHAVLNDIFTKLPPNENS
ncbi:N utilization substance protein B homolog,transcription antitermination protein NusB,transcription antitermination factor NusB,NusB family [Chlamydia serpentis]|uniref:Transcription antitermination protein NusB n=1 Tax=Chlamydia serpentis TaxID=1967782 RepID=A0A2R8FCE8_9CHLA|nr:transcription antitermination factor NusB [Chlamydia serpentis]SPN74094.1 N utilization substance protein B homolog,transcription antitermination protein NusB,transcription antitermination factor NusB,NusB family [Chlamydia serpentis]